MFWKNCQADEFYMSFTHRCFAVYIGTGVLRIEPMMLRKNHRASFHTTEPISINDQRNIRHGGAPAKALIFSSSLYDFKFNPRRM